MAENGNKPAKFKCDVPSDETDTGNPDTLTPSLAQAPNRTAKGTRQSRVKALETAAGGRFSGCRNWWAISGLGPDSGSAEAAAAGATSAPKESPTSARCHETGLAMAASPTISLMWYLPEMPANSLALALRSSSKE